MVEDVNVKPLYERDYLNDISQNLTLDALMRILEREENNSEVHLTRIRSIDFPRYSRKVFIGGLPYGINPRIIRAFFERYGPNVVDWPHRRCCNVIAPQNGYAFVIFNHEHAVRRLIHESDVKKGKLLIKITIRGVYIKTVQVKPWDLSYLRCILTGRVPTVERYSVFISNVPRTITAMELAQLLQYGIGNVVEVILKADPELNYPKGSARVVFGTREAYIIALAMRRFTLVTSRNRKVLEMCPYLFDDMICEVCHNADGVYFCSEFPCLLYYCIPCWYMNHQYRGIQYHEPVSPALRRLINWRQNRILRRFGGFMPCGYYFFQQQQDPLVGPNFQLFTGGYFSEQPRRGH